MPFFSNSDMYSSILSASASVSVSSRPSLIMSRRASSSAKMSKNTGALPEHQEVPYREYRGRDNSVNKTHEPKAPDGVAGDWR